jgi:hypothetical protein
MEQGNRYWVMEEQLEPGWKRRAMAERNFLCQKEVSFFGAGAGRFCFRESAH